MKSVQIKLPDDLNHFIEIQMAINQAKDKREYIVSMLIETMAREKENMEKYKKRSVEV